MATIPTSAAKLISTSRLTRTAGPTRVPDPPPTGAESQPAGAALRLSAVSKVYGHGPAAVTALAHVSIDVMPGEFVCLVGASGCGKSTLLSLVAGLEATTSGTIEIADRCAPGLMFQEPALFPWLTVGGNVGLPLRLRGVARAARHSRVRELLRVVRLEGLDRKRPHELSGGMRQRVALARTLALDSTVLLMDEPFGALDAMTRDLLHDEIERIWSQRRLTILFVTHDVREAARLGDRILLLSSRGGGVAWQRRVDVPRPRRIDSPEIGAIAAEATDRLRREGAAP